MQNIIHICERKTWLNAVGSGSYEPDSLESDGFIHCSQQDQVLDVANLFCFDWDDLVLLIINPQKVRADIRWENPAEPITLEENSDPEVFPHIYGPLNLDAIFRVLDLQRDSDGIFQLPEAIQLAQAG